MITDADGTSFALRDVPAGLTDDAVGVAFLVDKDSDSLPLVEIFLYPSEHQLRKIRIDLLRHIDQKYILVLMLELFIVHIIYVGKYRKYATKNGEEKFLSITNIELIDCNPVSYNKLTFPDHHRNLIYTKFIPCCKIIVQVGLTSFWKYL
jgi:hypothetical protein